MTEKDLMMILITRMEDKMVELMGGEAYSVWATETARDLFRLSAEDKEDCGFKDYVLANLKEITK